MVLVLKRKPKDISKVQEDSLYVYGYEEGGVSEVEG